MKIISAKSEGETFKSFNIGDTFRKLDDRIFMKTEELISDRRKVNSVHISSGLLAWTYNDERCHPVTTMTLAKEW